MNTTKIVILLGLAGALIFLIVSVFSDKNEDKTETGKSEKKKFHPTKFNKDKTIAADGGGYMGRGFSFSTQPYKLKPVF